MDIDVQVEYINKYLADNYGIDTVSAKPMFRVVFSEDQLEQRWTSYTNEGLQLLHPEVRLVPKYRQWIHEKYILERLTIIPSIKIDGSPVENLSYESIWVFEDKHGNALPPRIAVCKFVIDALFAAEGKKSLANYKDELLNESAEEKEIRLGSLQQELFGNETDIGDALAYKEGVATPHNWYGDKIGEC